MFCEKCGKQALPEEKFCSECGSPINFGHGSGQPDIQQTLQQKDDTTQSFVNLHAGNCNTQQNVAQNTESVEQPVNQPINSCGTQQCQNSVQDIPPHTYQNAGYNNGQPMAYSNGYNSEFNNYNDFNQMQPQKKSKKVPLIITLCSAAVVAVITVAVIFAINILSSASLSNNILGTWKAEDSNIDVNFEFKSDGTFEIPEMGDFLSTIISGYAGNSEFEGFDYSSLMNFIDMEYTISDDKTLSLDISISFMQIDNNTSQKFKWSEERSSSTWYLDGNELYIGASKFVRNN